MKTLHLILKMTTAQVVETSTTNNSLSFTRLITLDKHTCKNCFNPIHLQPSTLNQVLCVPKSDTATYGDRAFSAAAPISWNTLLTQVRVAQSVYSNTSAVKTPLFSATVHVYPNICMPTITLANFDITFSNSLISHKAKTKENHKRDGFGNMIKHLHKLAKLSPSFSPEVHICSRSRIKHSNFH